MRPNLLLLLLPFLVGSLKTQYKSTEFLFPLAEGEWKTWASKPYRACGFFSYKRPKTSCIEWGTCLPSKVEVSFHGNFPATRVTSWYYEEF